MKRLLVLMQLLVPLVFPLSAHAAGEWGFFGVATANGQAGIVLAGPGQRPNVVNGSPVQSWVYLGPPNTPTAQMAGYLQGFASQKAAGFFEYPGGLQAMIKDAKSRANSGTMGALVWMKSTPGNAQWDSAPTAIAVSAVAFSAAPAALGAIQDAAAATGGAGLTGAAGALAGKAKNTASSLLGGGSNANQPAEGTPAAALSTSAMAALAIVALEFDHHYLSGATKTDLIGGAFPQLYSTVTDYAWLFGVIAVALLCIGVMVTPWADGAFGALGAGIGGIAKAAVLIAAVPVLTVLMIAIVDELCGALWRAVPNAAVMFDGPVGTIAALAGTSAVAHLTHHFTIAHVTGTGAWFLSFVSLIAAGLIALEQLARDVGIFLTALFVPFALIAEIFTPLAGWGARILKMLFAVVFAKAILVLVLVAGAATLSLGLGSLSIVSIIIGLVILGIGALAPFMIYSALGHVGHAWHGRAVAGGVMSSMPMATQVRSAHARMQATRTATP